MHKEILNSHPLRLRLIDLEYKDLTQEEFIAEVRRIYFEETGENLNLNINYLSSDDSHALEGDASGYDGTTTHFYSAENLIDQVYDMVDKAVKAFDHQVDEMKTQTMTLYYQERGGSSF